MNLKFYKTDLVASPNRGTGGSAGIDFYLPEKYDKIIVEPNDHVVIDLCIKLMLPDGYYMNFAARSSMATRRGLIVGAAIIDTDYRGNVHAHLINIGKSAQILESGQKIIQGILLPNFNYLVQEIEYQDFEETGRGAFGSTGV